MKLLPLALSLIFALNAKAQSSDSLKWTPELSAELTTEQQVTHKGRYNCANLLRLHAILPIAGGVSLEAGSITTFMTSRESIGDDLQTFSNLDADRTLFALSVCGLNWDINDRHSLFLGIRNMNEDYFASPATSFFTNSSCGIYPTISANYDIANYPVSSLCMHYRYRESDHLAVQASLYNGTGYNRFFGRNNIFRICPKSDGVYGIAQLEYNNNGSQYYLGTCAYYNNDMSITPWFYAEQQLCNNTTLLAGYSHAFAAETECKDFIGVGLHYQRKKCELGIFTDYARYDDAREFATEITFKYNITANLYIQPVVHIISTALEESAYKATVRPVTSLRIGVSI